MIIKDQCRKCNVNFMVTGLLFQIGTSRQTNPQLQRKDEADSARDYVRSMLTSSLSRDSSSKPTFSSPANTSAALGNVPSFTRQKSYRAPLPPTLLQPSTSSGTVKPVSVQQQPAPAAVKYVPYQNKSKVHSLIYIVYFLRKPPGFFIL